MVGWLVVSVVVVVVSFFVLFCFFVFFFLAGQALFPESFPPRRRETGREKVGQ